MEVWNGKDALPMLNTNLAAKKKWYQLLNNGVFLMATAGSDNHDLSTHNFKIPRTYVNTNANSIIGLIEGLKRGNAFISNGPFVKAEISNKTYGESVRTDTHVLNYSVYSNEKIESIKIVKNGVIISQINNNELQYSGAFKIQLAASDFVTIEVQTLNAGYALTNPIFCK